MCPIPAARRCGHARPDARLRRSGRDRQAVCRFLADQGQMPHLASHVLPNPIFWEVGALCSSDKPLTKLFFLLGDRLRARFMETGGELPDYELLELLLFRSIPRRDVKPIAKQLI